MAADVLHAAAAARSARWGLLCAAAAPQRQVRLRLVQPLHVLSVRTLAPPDAPWAAAVHAAAPPALPAPGCYTGEAVRVAWLGPREYLVVTQDSAAAAGILAAWRPGRQALTCALDRSAGTLTVELTGPGAAALLARLIDAASVPPRPGGATRARCMDIAVTLLRLAPECVWLLADRSHEDYLAEWLFEAAERLALRPPGPPAV